jgi:hypothetical protein
MTTVVPLHVGGTGEPMLPGVVLLAILGSGALLALGLTALVRRQTLSYLLIALALSTLVLRSSLGALTIGGVVPFEAHHLYEHALDVLLTALVLAAVIYARRVETKYATGDNP